jgi:hypothetical protein
MAKMNTILYCGIMSNGRRKSVMYKINDICIVVSKLLTKFHLRCPFLATVIDKLVSLLGHTVTIKNKMYNVRKNRLKYPSSNKLIEARGCTIKTRDAAIDNM